MDRQISGRRGPVYSSRMVNRVVPSVPGARVKVRTPLNRPSGMPPLQVIRWPGVKSVTLTGKARPGLALDHLDLLPRGDGALDPLHARVPSLVAGGVGQDGPDDLRAGLDRRARVVSEDPFDALGDPNRRA